MAHLEPAPHLAQAPLLLCWRSCQPALTFTPELLRCLRVALRCLFFFCLALPVARIVYLLLTARLPESDGANMVVATKVCLMCALQATITHAHIA